MVFRDELTVLRLQRLVGDRRLELQDLIGVALGSDHVARLDVAELGVGEAETLGDLGKELLLSRMKLVVGLGDMEQTVEHVLEQLAVALEHGGSRATASCSRTCSTVCSISPRPTTSFIRER